MNNKPIRSHRPTHTHTHTNNNTCCVALSAGEQHAGATRPHARTCAHARIRPHTPVHSPTDGPCMALAACVPVAHAPRLASATPGRSHSAPSSPCPGTAGCYAHARTQRTTPRDRKTSAMNRALPRASLSLMADGRATPTIHPARPSPATRRTVRLAGGCAVERRPGGGNCRPDCTGATAAGCRPR